MTEDPKKNRDFPDHDTTAINKDTVTCGGNGQGDTSSNPGRDLLHFT